MKSWFKKKFLGHNVLKTFKGKKWFLFCLRILHILFNFIFCFRVYMNDKNGTMIDIFR